MIFATTSDWALLIGRLHPLIVHLPIGMLVIAVLFDLLSLQKKYSALRDASDIAWLLTSISSVGACIAGYLLSGEAAYNETVLALHQWSGISLAFLSTLIILLRKRKSFSMSRSLILSLTALIVLMFTGHQGGTLTHGDDYLSEPVALILGTEPEETYVPPVHPKIDDPTTAVIYSDLVKPLLEQKCVRCHNPDKAKGDLDLSDYNGLIKGGKGGGVLVAGSPDQSELYQRLLLPKSDKKHMPPRAKEQLSEAEIQLIEWWIREARGKQSVRVSEVVKTESIDAMLASFSGTNEGDAVTVENEFETIEVDTLPETVLAPLRASGLVVTRLSAGSALLSINCVNVPGFTGEQLKLLETVKKNIVWFKAGNTQLTNEDMASVGQFQNLTRLNLDHTTISASGIEKLGRLSRLQYLNLVGTQIDDRAVGSLSKLKTLKRLHVWNTDLTAKAVSELRIALPLAEITTGDSSIRD